jgi:hypothetical protein
VDEGVDTTSVLLQHLCLGHVVRVVSEDESIS